VIATPKPAGTEAASTRCCVVGGGPAGVMLGYLLARAGIAVTVLEKHADFLRDFRGDTVHPSTLQILDELGLSREFERVPQNRVDHLGVRIGGRIQPLVDFRGLKPFAYLALVPQWDFLDFMTAQAKARYPQFDLRMQHEAVGLVEDAGRVAGVRVRSPSGESQVRADLVVACDGRHSTLRQASGLQVTDFGCPIDVLWLRVSRRSADAEDTLGVVGANHLMVMLNRNDYWQIAYIVPKGSDRALRVRPIAELRASIGALAPFLQERLAAELTSWDQAKTLEVRVDRLERWHRPGLLLIGDAAHAMSPVGGVGINLAIQDAVAAANALVPDLRAGGAIGEDRLQAIQKRRLLPTKVVQALQIQIHKRVIARALGSWDAAPEVPALLRWLLGFRAVRHLPARLVGYGIRREHVAAADRLVRF